jgi:hypothetical protein
MERKLKYIIVEIDGLECAIVFNDVLIHKDIAKDMDVVSAGFCELGIDYVGVIAYGESTSLELKSRPEDEKIIEKTLFPSLDFS